LDRVTSQLDQHPQSVGLKNSLSLLSIIGGCIHILQILIFITIRQPDTLYRSAITTTTTTTTNNNNNNSHNLYSTIPEKLQKYKDLQEELTRTWPLNVVY